MKSRVPNLPTPQEIDYEQFAIQPRDCRFRNRFHGCFRSLPRWCHVGQGKGRNGREVRQDGRSKSRRQNEGRLQKVYGNEEVISLPANSQERAWCPLFLCSDKLRATLSSALMNDSYAAAIQFIPLLMLCGARSVRTDV